MDPPTEVVPYGAKKYRTSIYSERLRANEVVFGIKVTYVKSTGGKGIAMKVRRATFA